MIEPLFLSLKSLRLTCCIPLFLLFCSSSQAQPLELGGQWFSAAADWRYANQISLENTQLVSVEKPSLTGGRFFFQADFEVKNSGVLVLDFKNSSVIGLFHHRIFDTQGRLAAEVRGGIQSKEPSHFFLRHGRELNLPSGHYRLISELASPFLLAQPQPYLDELQHYRRAINTGNAVVLVSMGILFSLMFYYGILALVRRDPVDGMYALFILANLLYNMMALLVLPELFDMHWFYLISFPFLIAGNLTYIFFVIGLLGIHRNTHPLLHGAGRLLVIMFSIFAVLACFKPHWSLELVRSAVGLYLLYGLVCGIVRTREGHPTARYYLIAISMFFTMGIPTISMSGMEGVYTFYIEHLGLLAITVEAMLLSFVLAQQFSQLNKEKDRALALSIQNLRAASTDSLTGLPNRYALLNELQALPPQGSLTFIDLDGLKYYNDQFGHDRGDELLCNFGRLLQQRLPERARLHRLGGDEFAVTCPNGDLQTVEDGLSRALAELRDCGFELAGASFGSAHVRENPSGENLMNLADERMYQCKRQRKAAVAQHPAVNGN